MASRRLNFWNSAVTLAVVTASVSGLGAAGAGYIDYRKQQVEQTAAREKIRCGEIFEYLRDPTLNPDLPKGLAEGLATSMAKEAEKCSRSNT